MELTDLKLAQVTPKKAKEHLITIMRIAECPTCYNTLQPSSLKQCINGHVVCSPCREKLSWCPVCRSEFDLTTTRPLLFCQVLRSLPKFCKHQGCSTLLGIGDPHEDWCGFRPITCEVSDCGEVVVAELYELHLLADHSLKLTNQGNAADFIFQDLPDLVKSLCTVHAIRKSVPDYLRFAVFYQYFEDDKVLRVVVYFPIKSDYLLREKISGIVRLTDANNTVCFQLSSIVCSQKVNSPNLLKNFPIGVHLDIPHAILNKFRKLKSLQISTTIETPSPTTLNASNSSIKTSNPTTMTSNEIITSSNQTINTLNILRFGKVFCGLLCGLIFLTLLLLLCTIYKFLL